MIDEDRAMKKFEQALAGSFGSSGKEGHNLQEDIENLPENIKNLLYPSQEEKEYYKKCAEDRALKKLEQTLEELPWSSRNWGQPDPWRRIL